MSEAWTLCGFVLSTGSWFLTSTFVLSFQLLSVSEKKIKKVDKSEPEMKAHRHWHLPACDHCSDVDNAFDGLE